jgi:NCAIR mutase (PurE)-related protein
VYVDQRRIADQDLYRERIQKAIAQGKDVEKNKRRLEKLKKSTNSARYPNIKAELVKTLKDEAEALAVVYRRTGRHALRDNPKAKKKTLRVRKS